MLSVGNLGPDHRVPRDPRKRVGEPAAPLDRLGWLLVSTFRCARHPRLAHHGAWDPIGDWPDDGTESVSDWPFVARHVRAHGGTVDVQDRPGGGARFVVSLPLRRTDD